MKKLAKAQLPTKFGEFIIYAFGSDMAEYTPHLVLVSPHMDIKKPVLVRVHSECITGDLFGSRRCDCGEQLDKSLERISEEGGVLIYLRQEGRGIGIVNKLRAYNLQDEGLNTAEANTALGFEIDGRSFESAVKILKDLGIGRIKLLTNNPDKIEALRTDEIDVVDREKIIVTPCKENLQYLKTKQNELGHWLDIEKVNPTTA